MKVCWLWYLILLLGIGLYSCESDESLDIEEEEILDQALPPEVIKPLDGNKIDLIEILRLVNDVRTKGITRNGTYYPPVGEVTWNKTLESVALQHSKDMVDNNFFSHLSSDGTTMGERIKEANYDYRYVGENVAYGFTTEEDVVNAWLDSPGHCANIMEKNYTEMGVGRYEDHWTQDLGKHK